MKIAILAFLIDAIIGDPQSRFHPVVLIGKLISGFERLLYRKEDSDARKFACGALLVLLVLLLSYEAAACMLYLSYQLPFAWGSSLVSAFLLSFTISPKSLAKAGREIYVLLARDDLAGARKRVGWIVGRETEQLDAGEISRATVETIAENTTDGIIAPLFFFAIGGMPLAVLYRAANTMDSMLGYKNEKYLYFGRAAARLDDVLNYIPARLSALLMLAAGALLGMDAKNGWRIWRRDRRNHASPNSAQTESVCAGLLGVRLAGDAYYHGELHKKPYIGDALREIEYEDIPRAGRLLYATAALSLVLFGAVRFLLVM